MNRERAKELLPIIQAYAEGKEIECIDPNDSDDIWEAVEWLALREDGLAYRIKPEPREFWVNLYKDGFATHTSKESAKSMAAPECRETIHVREVL